MQKTRNHSAKNWCCQRLHDFRTRARAPHNRQKSGNDCHHRHHFWTQTKQRPFGHCFEQCFLYLASPSSVSFFRRLLPDKHHHDVVCTAAPNSAINPTQTATEKLYCKSQTRNTPPVSANGTASRICAASMNRMIGQIKRSQK